MPGLTSAGNIPFAQELDFADPQGLWELALAVDSDARTFDQLFTALKNPPAFLWRSTATATPGSFTTFSAADWDTSGTTTVLPDVFWSQDPGDVQSWWLFGFSFQYTVTGGASSSSDHNVGYLDITSFSPTDASQSTYQFAGYKVRTDTNTGGDAITSSVIAKIYQGNIVMRQNVYGPGTATRVVAAGARMWGIRLGDA
jgi:hypothetical protein